MSDPSRTPVIISATRTPIGRYLGALASALAAAAWDGESVQAAIFDTARGHDLPAGRAFTALYLAFLGRSSGPRAGWLLAALERDFVIGRLHEAATAGVRA